MRGERVIEHVVLFDSEFSSEHRPDTQGFSSVNTALPGNTQFTSIVLQGVLLRPIRMIAVSTSVRIRREFVVGRRQENIVHWTPSSVLNQSSTAGTHNNGSSPFCLWGRCRRSATAVVKTSQSMLLLLPLLLLCPDCFVAIHLLIERVHKTDSEKVWGGRMQQKQQG